jgi:hypothetical protein
MINNGRIDKCFKLYLPSCFGRARDLLKMSALRYFYPCAVDA